MYMSYKKTGNTRRQEGSLIQFLLMFFPRFYAKQMAYSELQNLLFADSSIQITLRLFKLLLRCGK